MSVCLQNISMDAVIVSSFSFFHLKSLTSKKDLPGLEPQKNETIQLPNWIASHACPDAQVRSAASYLQLHHDKERQVRVCLDSSRSSDATKSDRHTNQSNYGTWWKLSETNFAWESWQEDCLLKWRIWHLKSWDASWVPRSPDKYRGTSSDLVDRLKTKPPPED